MSTRCYGRSQRSTITDLPRFGLVPELLNIVYHKKKRRFRRGASNRPDLVDQHSGSPVDWLIDKLMHQLNRSVDSPNAFPVKGAGMPQTEIA